MSNFIFNYNKTSIDKNSNILKQKIILESNNHKNKKYT